jgi:diamine N-acetyltransferase
MEIRKANIADITLIRELCFQVWPQTYSSILSQQQIDYMLEMMYSPSSLQKQMQSGAIFILLYQESSPVGFASYQYLNVGYCKLHKLYILPIIQGKGAGKFMVDYIESDMRKNNASVLQLQVNKQNEALFFYKKLGFIIAREAVFEIGEGYVMDDFIMEKKL